MTCHELLAPNNPAPFHACGDVDELESGMGQACMHTWVPSRTPVPVHLRVCAFVRVDVRACSCLYECLHADAR